MNTKPALASTRLTPELELRASVDTFDGRVVAHLRYFRKCGRKWLPTTKGIALRPEVPPWLAGALKGLLLDRET